MLLMLKVFDPRKGETFEMELENGRRFSSKEHGFLVLDSVPKSHLFGMMVTFSKSFDLNEIKVIPDCMQKTGKLGFLICNPGPTGLDKDEIGFSDLDYLGGSACGYFSLQGGSLTKVLRLSNESRAEGEWVIGSCFKAF